MLLLLVENRSTTNAKVLHADVVVPVLKLRLVLFTLAAWSCGMNPLHAFKKAHPWIYDALAPVKGS